MLVKLYMLILRLAGTGSARMDRVTLNAGCRRSDGRGIDRQSFERLAVYYSRLSVCLSDCESRFYFTTIDVRRASPRPRSTRILN